MMYVMGISMVKIVFFQFQFTGPSNYKYYWIQSKTRYFCICIYLKYFRVVHIFLTSFGKLHPFILFWWC